MSDRRKFISGIGLAVALAFAPVLVPGEARALGEPEAQAHVQKMVDEVLALVRADGSPQSKADDLRGIMETGAAMPQIAKFAAGRVWRSMSEDQRERYVPAFSHFLSTIYARRFQDYSGEELTIDGSVDAGRKGILVKSKVTQQGAAPAAVDWLVTDRPGRVVIADIIIEGISMLTTQREEISGMIEARGGDVEKLITDLAAAS